MGAWSGFRPSTTTRPPSGATGTPYVPVSQDGKLLPNVLELIAWIGTQPQLVLETGHVTPREGLMVIREARRAASGKWW